MENAKHELLGEEEEHLQDNPDYIMAELYFEITERIYRLMEQLEISQADLSQRLGVSRARVSNILSDVSNLTLKTIARMLAALRAEMSIQISRRGEKQRRSDWIPTREERSRGQVFIAIDGAVEPEKPTQEKVAQHESSRGTIAA